MKKVLVSTCFVLFFVSSVISATIQTVTSGSNLNWNNGASWVGGVKPGAGDDAVIRVNLIVNSNQTVGNITINSGRALTISGGVLTFSNLTITGVMYLDGGSISGSSILLSGGLTIQQANTITLSGNFTNNGNFIDNSSGGILSFSGTSTLSGTNSLDVYNINVLTGANLANDLNNGLNAGLNLWGMITLAGTGNFDADGSGSGILTVMSSDESTGGRIGALPDPTRFTGNVTVQRYIDGATNGDYRYLSMPITNGNASFWKTAFGVTGDFSDKSTNAEFPNIIQAGNGNPSIYSFNPSTQAYVALSGGGAATTATAVSNLSGYAVYDFLNTFVVVEYRGTIGKGNVVIPISGVSGGFSLVPNPYPSPLNWDAVYQANSAAVTGAIWWRTAAYTYFPYAGSLGAPPPNVAEGQIATGQAVWVESAGNGSTLTISESHKTAGDNFGIFKRQETPINYFRIMLASATQKDYAVIRFHENTTDEKDNYYDAVKRSNGNYIPATNQYSYINLSSYTTNASKDYSINSVDELNNCSKLIGLKIVDVKPGDHKLQFTSLEKLELKYKVILVDNFLNKEKVISNNDEYQFIVTTDAASSGDARFKLRIEKAVERLITVQGQSLISNISTGNQWYKDGVLIPGATASTFDVITSGNYTVKSTVDGCAGTSDAVTMSITSTPETLKEINFVYPNPTHGKITINLTQDRNAELTGVYIYDLKGSKIISSDDDSSLLKPGEKTIDISNSKNGVYILNLVSKREVKSIRLIKK